MKKFLILIIFSATACDSWCEPPSVPVQRIERYLTKAEKNGYSGSVLISLGGKILLNDAYGMADREKKIKFTPDTIFDIGSITKQFTAACILKLESEGKLSVQDPITKYFDAVPDDKKGLKLHHLLTHTAGLTGSLGSDEEMIGKEDYLKLALSSPLIHAPGTYDYSNVGFSLLAAIIEKVSRQDYETYLREKILKPSGMHETGYALPAWDRTRMAIGYEGGQRWGTTFEKSRYDKGVTWHLKGNGGIHSTTKDMHLWYVALSGNSILNAAAKEKYFAEHVKVGDGKEFYAYGWSVLQNEGKEKVISHNGGNGYFMATMAMIPEKRFDIIVSTNDDVKNTDVIASRIARILFENLEELDDAFLKTYTGIYTMPSGAAIPVTFNENDEAVLLLNHREAWLLFGGSEKEDPKRAEHFDQRTRTLIQAVLDGKTGEVASLSGLPQEEVAEGFGDFRTRLEEQNGKCETFNVVGSVSRRGGSFYLSPVQFDCANKIAYTLIIWQGERLYDLRRLPEGNTKNFEHRKDKEFFAESTSRAVQFDQMKGTSVLKIQQAGKETLAVKATP
jgi:CubicO group peptidase (beta-lactamase class C family)